jgi:TonB-dependent starch-binding outer membrane protein SusC
MWRQKGIGLVLGGLALLITYGCGGGHAPPADRPEANEVAVGYGTQSEDAITGSVSSVRMDDVKEFRSARIEEYLEGRVPGLYVWRTGSGYSIRIRGINTLYGNGDPLLVVDGLIVAPGMTASTLSAINPADVREVQVLKDASSTAIFGSRGGNGVIIISTRGSR